MTSVIAEKHSTDKMQKENAARRTEVFVGGLPRSISEEKINEVFSPCGEIVEIRMIKDPKGNLKGFCFVRFTTKEAAAKAVKEKSGLMIDGKKIGVLPSSEQDTLYFGNLNKAWTADEFERIVVQNCPDVESIDLPMPRNTSSGQKHRNRGFALVKFSSHAAAARALRVGSQPGFRLGNLHPVVQWAEQDPDIDPEELAKIKIAFVKDLPVDADENYLKQLFEPFGKVEKVVVSKKSSLPVGFVHFAERSDLDNAIKELNEKTVPDPKGDQMHKLQVEVARPMDRNKKRARENPENKSSAQGHSKLLKERAREPKKDDSHIPRELESADPYEDAVLSLTSSVKERLLRILRLGIATRYDIDLRCLCSLKELPESIAIAVLDQFMLSAAALNNKGDYLAGLISRQLDRLGLGQNYASLPKVADIHRDERKQFGFPHQVSPPLFGSASHAHSHAARVDNYIPRYASPPPLHDYPLPSRTLVGRIDARDQDFLLSNRSLTASQSTQIPRMVMLDERSHSPFDAAPGYGRIGLRNEERPLSPVLESRTLPSYSRQGPPAPGPDMMPASSHPTSRPQMRFDPFTGEPYKFDPFTGEPIRPS